MVLFFVVDGDYSYGVRIRSVNGKEMNSAFEIEI